MYYWVKQVHIAMVALSFLLFLARGSWVLAGRRLPRHPVMKVLPHAVDTVLLTSALWLTTIVQQYPFSNAWLTTKVVLLAVYIVLGSLALGRAPTRAWRALAFAGAVVVFMFIYSVARLRHPLGILAYLTG